MSAHGEGFLEHREHLVRSRAGGDVEILRFAAQQQVAYATANKVGLVAGGAQPGNDLRCCMLGSAECRFCHVYYYRNVSQPSQPLSGAQGAYTPGNGLILAI